MVRVEQCAEIRRLHFVKDLSIKEIARRTGLDRNTARRALRGRRATPVRRDPRSSIRSKDEIHCLLGDDPRLPGQRCAS